ncbi:MAG: cyclase family protein [Planctomycetota bacterium]
MNVIDLTLTVRHGMRGVAFETATTVAREGWNARTLHLYSHSGTHMDAPLHFDVDDQTIDEIPLSKCIGKAWIVNLLDLPPKAPITVDHLGSVALQHQPGDGLLLHTGWSRHVDQPDYYRDQFAPISPELAHWMVDHQVRMVGVEPPSVGDVNDLPAVTQVHRILLGGGVIIVEGLTGLEQLRGPTCTFGAMPLKIERGDGAPCRAFAMDTVP